MAAARKYEALTDGSEALIIQFVNKPSEEAALKAFNEVARQSALSSTELKNIAIDEIRKELKELATKGELQATRSELQATKNELKAEIKALDNKIDGVEKTLKAENKALQAEINTAKAETKALIEGTEKRLTRYLLGILAPVLILLVKALFFK